MLSVLISASVLKENICCGYSLEALVKVLLMSTYMFSSRNKEIII